MKRLIYIALSMLIPLCGFGQGMYSIDPEVSFGKVHALASQSEVVFAVTVGNDDSFDLVSWDEIGLQHHSDITMLPGASDDAFEVIDAVFFNGDLFVAGAYTSTRVGQQSFVLKWDGSTWTDIGDTSVTSFHVDKLVVFRNAVRALGAFDGTNIMTYSGASWSSTGGKITKLATDYIVDASAYQGKLYCSGFFTGRFGTDYSLAIFDGSKWQPAQMPPFLGQSQHFSQHNGHLYLSGRTGANLDLVKRFNGETWDDLSAGITDINVNSFVDMEVLDGAICLLGDFTDPTAGKNSNFLIKTDGSNWRMGDQPTFDSRIRLHKWKGRLLLAGEFDCQGIQNLGELSPSHAVLRGYIYKDLNNNCQRDSGETGIANAKLILSPGDRTFFSNSKGYYEVPVLAGPYSITFTPRVSEMYGCGRVVTGNVTELIGYELPELTSTVKPNVVDLDLHASLMDGWRITPNTYNELRLTARNNGSVDIEGATLRLRIGDWWNAPNISPAPDDFIDGEYIWKLKNMSVGERYEIVLSGITKAELDQYTSYKFSGEVDAPQTDADGSSNLETGIIEAGDDLDPISKQSSLGTWFTPDVDEVTYQIRMENITNDVVDRLKVQDTLDADLVPTYAWDYTDLGKTLKTDIKTVVMPDGSWRYVYTWTTEDANLQPPKQDEDGSNVGYVEIKFALHEVSRKVGTEICNRAKVYFENYEPVRTNEVCTEARPLGIHTPKHDMSLDVYPNPTSGLLHVVNKLGDRQAYQVLNQLGQVMTEGSVNGYEKLELDMSSWAPGVYLLRVNEGQAIQVLRY